LGLGASHFVPSSHALENAYMTTFWEVLVSKKVELEAQIWI